MARISTNYGNSFKSHSIFFKNPPKRSQGVQIGSSNFWLFADGIGKIQLLDYKMEKI
jgi:hypothetical protein